MPRPFGTVGHLEQASLEPQTAQLAQSPPPVVPAFPKAAPHVSARPAFQSEDAAAFFGQVEVSPPTAHEGAPVGSQFGTAQALAAPPQFPDFLLIPLQTLRGGFDLSFRVDPEAQELAFPGPPCSALGRIDFQSQLSPDPLGQARQYPLCRSLTAHVHVAVIRVSAKADRKSTRLNSS